MFTSQPSGMSMNATSGALYGAPTASGTFNITVTVQDSSSSQQTASKVLTLTVAPAAATLSITSTAFNPSTATVGTAYSAVQAMAATGGTGSYTWSISGRLNWPTFHPESRTANRRLKPIRAGQRAHRSFKQLRPGGADAERCCWCGAGVLDEKRNSMTGNWRTQRSCDCSTRRWRAQ